MPKERPAADLVDRAFTASRLDELWVADITEIPPNSSKFYLTAIIDVWSRKVVGGATSTQMPAALVIQALDKQRGVRISMDSVGDCYDNAMAESFFATLECELLNLVQKLSEPKDVEIALFEYIEGVYNIRHQHRRLNHLSPVQFEETMANSLYTLCHSKRVNFNQPPMHGS